jgi:hypothetical protein
MHFPASGRAVHAQDSILRSAPNREYPNEYPIPWAAACQEENSILRTLNYPFLITLQVAPEYPRVPRQYPESPVSPPCASGEYPMSVA